MQVSCQVERDCKNLTKPPPAALKLARKAWDPTTRAPADRDIARRAPVVRHTQAARRAAVALLLWRWAVREAAIVHHPLSCAHWLRRHGWVLVPWFAVTAVHEVLFWRVLLLLLLTGIWVVAQELRGDGEGEISVRTEGGDGGGGCGVGVDFAALLALPLAMALGGGNGVVAREYLKGSFRGAGGRGSARGRRSEGAWGDGRWRRTRQGGGGWSVGR